MIPSSRYLGEVVGRRQTRMDDDKYSAGAKDLLESWAAVDVGICEAKIWHLK